ncbi:hypothetical protein [Acinetobacter sp. ASP199]|uniref:hypothetical protein n=1 Tax=unclassified Acinetobacter TaxID=196816 RepID=UPI001F6105CC|nr:hypothetical protein [Acinetobacter sp. ASP199]UNT60015.1 hypothetical protein IHE35_04075 [Acinetobacter sp. ASP199]
MMIAKGPFKRVHQTRALAQVIQARLFNRVTTQQAKTFYLALLNLESYMTKLSRRKRKRR